MSGPHVQQATLHNPEASWLVVIDPQRIFADPASEWCAPAFDAIVAPVRRLVAVFGDRVIVTRWLPGTRRAGSWTDYFARWDFADRPNSDPYFDLVPEMTGLTGRPTVDVGTFGKWPELATVTREPAHLVLTGVATDCCVISTALAAADAGCWVEVISDGCAGSSPENHAAAMQVMGLYAPQIEVVTSDQVLSRLRDR